jgi:SAM-dependent methyltransferase
MTMIDRPEISTGFYPGEELLALQQAPHYYAAILHHFRLYLGKRVIEVGAGIGTFSKVLLTCPQISKLTVVEPAENLFPVLQANFSGDNRVSLVHGHLDDRAASAASDSVVLINVLEHSQQDEALLRTIHRVLKPGGTLLLFVPALPSLYGSLDEAFGHVRRYTKPGLNGLLQKVGFQTIRLRYFNLVGTVSWFFAGKVFKRRSLQATHVRLYDRFVMSWVAKLERTWSPPLGQSLLVVAKKTNPHES